MSKPSLKSVKETEIKGMDREFDILGNQERDTKTDEINTVSTDREFSNNATTTELVNKSVDPKEFASVEQTDKSTIEVRTEEIMHDVDKTLDAPTVQNQETQHDSPSAISDVNTKDYIEVKDFEENNTPEVLAYTGSSCTESPCVKSQDELEETDEDDEEFYREAAGDERMTLIEEEYIDRITLLERRNYDLETVLFRLSSAVERLLCLGDDREQFGDVEVDDGEIAEPCATPNQEPETLSEATEVTQAELETKTDFAPESETVAETEKVGEASRNTQAPEEANEKSDEAGEGDKTCEESTEQSSQHREIIEDPSDVADSSARCISRHICIELFVEFQKKLSLFASELKGVLNCSESAIRHGRVVQEWGKSVQLMFEQLLHERKKMMNFIEERECLMMKAREQFLAEKELQGTQLQHLVAEMKNYRELMDTVEEICREKAVERSYRHSVAEGLVELLLKKRLEEERAIILGLTRQSKISEMKLFIMHQQNCIQDLQIQNKELRAVIEGLVGPDDTDDEQVLGTDNLGTPASTETPDRLTVSETLAKVGDQPISLVSDVLHCDRGNYLPGLSTDGDLATVQAYDIGRDSECVEKESEVVFDPLTVDYVREHCQQAEESERQALASVYKSPEETCTFTDTTETMPEADKIQLDNGKTISDMPEDGRETPEADRGVLVMQDGVQVLNIEPYLRKRAEEESLVSTVQDAAGDGIDISKKKTPELSTELPDPWVTGHGAESETVA